MEIPDYWAEARKQYRDRNRQVTVRRFGWSTKDQADAEAMAAARASEALAQILSGAKLRRREHKVAYNGADGVPIREEVLSRHGEQVITRNSYGAHCLNSPQALFADIDYATGPSCWMGLLWYLAFACALLLCVYVGSVWGAWLGVLLLLSLIALPWAAIALWRSMQPAMRPAENATQDAKQLRKVRQRLEGFLRAHPDWNVRLYRTPNGARLLATHQPFDPTSTDVQTFFRAVGVDGVYRRMCERQRCFRARLTGKPWRMGIGSHMRPRPGVWPVAAERMQERNEWVSHYERLSPQFAACRFIDSLGSGRVHPELRDIIEMHDRESRALETHLPIA